MLIKIGHWTLALARNTQYRFSFSVAFKKVLKSIITDDFITVDRKIALLILSYVKV